MYRLAPKPTTHIRNNDQIPLKCGCIVNDLNADQYTDLKVSFTMYCILNSL